MKNKKDLQRDLNKLMLHVQQQIVHLKILRHIPDIKNNHDVLASLDLIIYKLWDKLNMLDEEYKK